MTNGSTDQQQLKSNSMIHLVDETIGNESPLVTQQVDAYDALQSNTLESLDWNTSLVSQVRFLAFSFMNESILM